MEDVYINFTLAISKLNRIIQKIKSFEIGKYGLQPIHIACGYYLSKNPQGLTAKQLSAMSMEDKAAISRALKTLQKDGIVEYAPHGRNEIVKLTPKGVVLSEEIGAKIKAAVYAGSAHIDEKQRTYFYSSLLRISNNLIDYYQSLLTEEGKPND